MSQPSDYDQSKNSMTYIRLQMAVQDAINHIQDFVSILFSRPRGFLTQYHKIICFSGSSLMPRVHFGWPQKLSHRPTLFFFLLIKEDKPPILLLMYAK